jgi:hypothetical protein
MNGHQHFWLFIGCWIIFFIISVLYLNIFFRVLLGIFLIPSFNPDSDLSFDPETHRSFYTHSLIPTTLFWICIFPAITGEYQYFMLLILWFYPWVHLMGDLKIAIDEEKLHKLKIVIDKKAYGGTWRISTLPAIRIRLNKKTDRKELDLQWHRLTITGSWIWVIGNIVIGIVGAYLIIR